METIETICKTCARLEVNCPLHGMSDMMDVPLEGNMMTCTFYRSPEDGRNGIVSLDRLLDALECKVVKK